MAHRPNPACPLFYKNVLLELSVYCGLWPHATTTADLSNYHRDCIAHGLESIYYLAISKKVC